MKWAAHTPVSYLSLCYKDSKKQKVIIKNNCALYLIAHLWLKNLQMCVIVFTYKYWGKYLIKLQMNKYATISHKTGRVLISLFCFVCFLPLTRSTLTFKNK